MARKTKAEQEREQENEELAGQLAKLDEELGEHVVVSNHASLDQYPRTLIRALSERLGRIASLLEFFVTYERRDCDSCQLRVRVAREVLVKPSLAYQYRDVIKVLGVSKLKEHVKATYSEVAEIVTLKRKVKKLEDQLEEERRERMSSFYDRRPWSPWGPMMMHTMGR
jgi:hypothetical protein